MCTREALEHACPINRKRAFQLHRRALRLAECGQEMTSWAALQRAAYLASQAAGTHPATPPEGVAHTHTGHIRSDFATACLQQSWKTPKPINMK